MTIRDWLNTFIDENKLDRDYIFEIRHEKILHIMEFEFLIHSILLLPYKYQQKIKDDIIKINYQNGDVIHFLNYVAEGLVKYNFFKSVSRLREISS